MIRATISVKDLGREVGRCQGSERCNQGARWLVETTRSMAVRFYCTSHVRNAVDSEIR